MCAAMLSKIHYRETIDVSVDESRICHAFERVDADFYADRADSTRLSSFLFLDRETRWSSTRFVNNGI